ncbi:MAG: 2-hydroxychromene-2-carboxylate isomerase [Chromatiales bacterium]|jgi:2-hydroxychromene-2-carboxylate isomerase|nr:2-hydroxychromene-2-carboxylate isomerase [Chromatiales bacterium]
MPEIEYFYSAHSAFAYLGSARFMDVARDAGRTIVHKPYYLTRGITGVGSTSTRDRPANHRAYYFGREIERWSQFRDAPVVPDGRPTHHWNDMTLANCLLIAAGPTGPAVDALAHAMLQAHWRDDADLANEDALRQLVKGVGVDPAVLFASASDKQVTATYEANTAEAITRSVFGSPTYFADGDMFYGQDHLELLERALVKPFAGPWPRP